MSLSIIRADEAGAVCRADVADIALEEEQIVSIISVGLASNILSAAWEAHEVAGPPDLTRINILVLIA